MWERFATAIKIDRIPLFDVGRWTFDVRRSLVSFIDQTGCPLAGGPARVKHYGYRARAGLGTKTRPTSAVAINAASKIPSPCVECRVPKAASQPAKSCCLAWVGFMSA
jgi:hypothetical protein